MFVNIQRRSIKKYCNSINIVAWRNCVLFERYSQVLAGDAVSGGQLEYYAKAVTISALKWRGAHRGGVKIKAML